MVSTKKAVAYTAIAKYSTVVMQLLFTMVLSRLLNPTEFGTVAVVTVFISFFTLLSDMGLGAGVIQNKNLTKDDVDHIFTCSILIGAFLMLVFVGLSYPISIIYSDNVYLRLCPILSMSILFQSANMIPNAIMLKEKRFKSIAIRTISCYLLSASITIVLALKGWGVYALCFNHVLSSLLVFVWNEYSTRLALKIKLTLGPIRSIWGYSFYQFASQTINFFCRNLDSLIVGKVFCKADLAYYNKSYSLMMMPISFIPGVITPVLHPILSEYQNDKFEIYKRFKKLATFLIVIGVIFSVFCFAFGNEIIQIMFGSQWENAILPFRILGLSLFGQLMTNIVAPIYQSLGDTRSMFNSIVITSAIIIGSICIGACLGSIITVAAMVSIAYSLNFFITYYILIHKVFKFSFRDFISLYAKDFCMMAVAVVALIFFSEKNDTITSLLVRIGIFVSYLFSYIIIGKRYKDMLIVLRK